MVTETATETLEDFFRRYEEGANTFDVDLVTSEFTPEFMAAGPQGVVVGKNDEGFRAAIPQRKAFFQQIGFQRAKILSIAPTPLDERYTLVKVHWEMVFEPPGKGRKEFRFFLTYVVFNDQGRHKVAFYISHDDEEKVMREGGLIP